MKLTSQNNKESLESMIEKYNREMMQLYAQQLKKTASAPAEPVLAASAVQAAVTDAPPAPIKEQEKNPEPAPEPERTPVPEPAPEPEPQEENERPETDTGYIQVRTFTAREAIPIAGALVTITQENEKGTKLQWAVVTDQDGLTPKLKVPAVSSQLSLQPGTEQPYSPYTIQVDMPGFYRVKFMDVPIYGGITAIQPVKMIPLPEGTVGMPEMVFPETGPEEL